jgi:glycosyltransferase involved in cell wall biosynthesis
MACGCPVIACAKGSIPEVAGDAALYVAEDDIEAMENALVQVVAPGTRASLRAQGLERAQAFSWERMAARVSTVMLDVVNREPVPDPRDRA